MESVLVDLRAEAGSCTRCPLYANATQTVFGEGPVDADIVFIGEQPGDREDIVGHPFVGPAGAVLDRALADAGIDRTRCYVTNAVKHFKFEPRGKRRLHKAPNVSEIAACKWWLDRELSLVEAPILVALGATALRALAGSKATLANYRGRPHKFDVGRTMFATVHPSYLLRIPDEDLKQREVEGFVRDMTSIASAARETG